MADVWTDDVDALLRDLQSDVPEYTSANYWRNHPEHYALLETAVGFLWMFGTELQRLEERSDVSTELDASPLTDVSGPGDIEDELLTENVTDMIETIQSDAEQYRSPEFWDQNYESRVALVSGLTALRSC